MSYDEDVRVAIELARKLVAFQRRDEAAAGHRMEASIEVMRTDQHGTGAWILDPEGALLSHKGEPSGGSVIFQIWYENALVLNTAIGAESIQVLSYTGGGWEDFWTSGKDVVAT